LNTPGIPLLYSGVASTAPSAAAMSSFATTRDRGGLEVTKVWVSSPPWQSQA
jgi:hypothetical protein